MNDKPQADCQLKHRDGYKVTCQGLLVKWLAVAKSPPPKS
jgi:hypothetical protein